MEIREKLRRIGTHAMECITKNIFFIIICHKYNEFVEHFQFLQFYFNFNNTIIFIFDAKNDQRTKT